jgi:hypothetical protein
MSISAKGQDLYSSVRSNDSMMSRSMAAGPHMSGVGIFFQQEPDGKVRREAPLMSAQTC